MTEQRPPHSPDLLDWLLAQEEQYVTRLREIRAAISTIRDIREAPASPEEVSHTPTEATIKQPTTIPTSSPFFGKSLVDSAYITLEKANEPMRVSELIEKMRQDGFIFASQAPSASLYWALRKRQKDGQDFVSLPQSKWGLLKWRLKDPAFAKMHAGLAAAKARGVKGGSRTKMTPERVAEYDKLKAEGKSQADIARAVGMSKPGLIKWIARQKEEGPGDEDNEEG